MAVSSSYFFWWSPNVSKAISSQIHVLMPHKILIHPLGFVGGSCSQTQIYLPQNILNTLQVFSILWQVGWKWDCFPPSAPFYIPTKSGTQHASVSTCSAAFGISCVCARGYVRMCMRGLWEGVCVGVSLLVCLNGSEAISPVVLVRVFLTINDTSMFSCAYWPFVCLLWRNIYSDAFPSFNWVIIILFLRQM